MQTSATYRSILAGEGAPDPELRLDDEGVMEQGIIDYYGREWTMATEYEHAVIIILLNEVRALRQEKAALDTFVHAFRRAVETEYVLEGEPPLWLKNGYDDARELCGLTPENWPAPWEAGGRL